MNVEGKLVEKLGRERARLLDLWLEGSHEFSVGVARLDPGLYIELFDELDLREEQITKLMVLFFQVGKSMPTGSRKN